MVTSPLHAVLVKTAALGLDPNRHLGKSIQQLQGHLEQLRDRYGCNVCGEGGEYESLTLDCPLFKYARIVLDEWQVRAQYLGMMSIKLEIYRSICGNLIWLTGL